MINLGLGIGLGYLPEWYWNKRQVTFTYGMVSIGVITLGLCLFVFLSELANFKGKAFVMFGMNPFLTYLVTELLIQLPDELDLFDMFGEAADWGKLGWGLIVFLLMFLMNWLLFRKKKTVKTEYATLGFYLIIFALSFVL